MRLRFIGILAVLAMIMAFAAAPVAADHGGAQGEGQADCPTNTVFLHNFNQSELVVGLELTNDVFVRTVTRPSGGEATSITVENTSDRTVTIAVKGGSDQVGNFVTLAPGQLSGPISVTNNPTISNLSVCAGPFTPTLTLDKVVTTGDANQQFAFTLNGSAIGGGGTLSANDQARVIATTALDPFTIVETLPGAGWALATISCVDTRTQMAISTTPVFGTDGTTLVGVTGTLGADQDVLCTFTNGFTPLITALSPTLTLDKEVTAGADRNQEFGFTYGLSGAAATTLNPTLSANDAAVLLASSAGTYVITEQALGNWNLQSISCTGDSGTQESVVLGQRMVTVTVGANDDVLCTFVNTPTAGPVLGGNPTPTPTPVVRQGTLASVPNTAMDGPMNQLPVALLALLALGSLGYLGRRNLLEIRNRR